MALVKIKQCCPVCKAEHEHYDTKQMTDKEYFVEWWTPTIGREEAEKSWEEKQKQPVRATHMVSSDIGGYVSQVDGTWIESRSKHRDHLKRHGMVELGNDVPQQHKKLDVPKPEDRKRQIAEQVYAKLRY
jgi:hypothetical protein